MKGKTMHKINLTAAQNKILEKAKITCAEQLIRQMPNRYDDCRQVCSVDFHNADKDIPVIGVLTSISSKTSNGLFRLFFLINLIYKRSIRVALDKVFLFMGFYKKMRNMAFNSRTLRILQPICKSIWE